MKIKNKNLLLNIFWTFLYAIVTLIVVLHHEIWADEAQVWMIAKHISFFGLFKHLVNEGHPSFFYLLVMPFAKLHSSILAMQLICWLSSSAAVFLILNYSPFNSFTKFSIITGAGFLYFFPVIARSYSILPLLVFLLAVLYPKAKEKPIIYAIVLALTANTHVIMFGFCTILTVFFFLENIYKKQKSKDIVTAFSIMILGLCALVLQLHGTTSSNVFIKYDVSNLIGSTIKVFSQFFINAYDNQYGETGQIIFPLFGLGAIFLSVFLYLTFFVTLFLKNKKLFSIAFFSILFQLIVYIVGYNHWIFATRIFCAHIILIFCFWQLLYENDKVNINKTFINTILAVFFLATMLNGLRYTILDLKYSYSGAKETALFIEKNIDKNNSFIISDNPPYTVSLVYYLDGKYDIYSAAQQMNITYVVWNKMLYYMLNNQTWDMYVKLLKQDNKNLSKMKIFAIISFYNRDKLDIKDLKNFKLIFQSTPAIMKYEGYSIYEYTAGF